MKCIVLLCVELISLSKAEISAADLERDKGGFNPFPLFGVLRNEMSSNNLTFVINCAQRDYYRYEFAIEMVLKKIPIAYRIVQMDHVDFRDFIAKHILHQLTTSGEQWYDIFMLCWDDGRNSTSVSLRPRPIDQLVEVLQRKNHEIGNVRWIFFTWETIMRSIQRICGVVYVDLNESKPKVYSEPMEEIRKCGGRMVFLDYEGGQQNLLRNPSRIDASIFKHEIKFERLGYVTVLCEFTVPVRKYFCGEEPQKEIFAALSQKVNVSLRKSAATYFGKCIDEESDDIFLRGKCSGFLEDMQNRLFDVCAINIYPTQNISMALHLITSYYRFDQLSFFAPPAQRIIGSFKSILLPFQSNVWLLTGLSMILSSIVLSLMTKRAFRVFGLLNHLFYVSMIATGRVPTIPDCFHRVTYIALLLAALLLANTLLSQFYAGVVTSFRQHPPTTPVIDTLASLERILKTEPDAIRVAVLDDTKYNAILNPREPTDLMRLIKNHSTPCRTKPDCVRLVLDRRHVLLATDYNLMTEIGTNPQTQAITRAKDNIFAGRYSLPVQRGSPIIKQLMNFNDKLFEGGVFQHIDEKESYESKPTFEKERPPPPNSELTVEDLNGLMKLYAGTVLISSVSFFAEKVYFWILRARHRRDERKGSPSTSRSTPAINPRTDADAVGYRFPYHPASESSASRVRRSEPISKSYRAQSKRVFLLYDKDGNTLDLVYM